MIYVKDGMILPLLLDGPERCPCEWFVFGTVVRNPVFHDFKNNAVAFQVQPLVNGADNTGVSDLQPHVSQLVRPEKGKSAECICIMIPAVGIVNPVEPFTCIVHCIRTYGFVGLVRIQQCNASKNEISQLHLFVLCIVVEVECRYLLRTLVPHIRATALALGCSGVALIGLSMSKYISSFVKVRVSLCI